MKRLFTIITLIVALFTGNSYDAAAQRLSNKELKEIEKESKKRCKQLKKEGWEPVALTITFERAMIKFNTYIAQDEENHIPLIGIAVGSNPKIGRENAMYSAIANYAARANAQVTGKLKSTMSSDMYGNSLQEIDRFGAEYESAVSARIGGLIKEHFTIMRETKTGAKEFNIYMSIDETEARKARKAAALEAQRRAKLETANLISEEFINQPVDR